MLWWTLRQLKSKNPETRKRAVKKLGKSGNAKAVEPLIDALKDNDHYGSEDAATILGKISDGRAVEPLIDALEAKSNVRENAILALDELLTLGLLNESQKATLFIAKLEWDKVVELGVIAVEPLISSISHQTRREFSWEQKCKVIETLGKIGDTRAVERLIDTLKNPYLCLKSVFALGEIGDVRAVEPLINALDGNYPSVLQGNYPDIRQAAAITLGIIGDVRAVAPLLNALKDSEPDVRQEAASALTALQYEPEDPAQKTLFFAASQDWDQIIKLGVSAVRSLCTVIEIYSEPIQNSLPEKIIHQREKEKSFALIAPINKAKNSLQIILEISASKVEEEVLHKIIQLNDYAIQLKYEYDSCSSWYEVNLIECPPTKQLKQLARQELIRRGIEA